MKGPVLINGTPKPLADCLVAEIIRERLYLSVLRQQLHGALQRCKHTTEMFLVIRSLDTSSASGKLRTFKLVESLVENLPPRIPDITSSTFEPLPEWGRTALGWIAYCKRPLRLSELATAVAITDRRANFTFSFDLKVLPIDFAADIRSVFDPLVRLEGGGIIFSNDIVEKRFYELLVEESKLRGATKRMRKAMIPDNRDITTILFRYLSWPEFFDPVNARLKLEEFTPPPGPLFKLAAYATQVLPFHYQTCTKSDDLPGVTLSRQLVLM
ncbi:hypothetical protein B0H63DRAFT_71625 [Podospora didyma]|uniref:Uncharacterized protein n=1 Tax=Podospora didyma TaxID=330526 RepID=A0AAE0K232_9PEZI|nr:hypothetical protein B0H63DRAFT_71625 [Podospora didyma]